MAKLLAVLAAGGSLALAASPATAQELRIAFIDSRAIIAQAPGAAEAQTAFERDMARYHAELEQLETELEQMIREYDQRQVMLAPEARQQRQDAIIQKQREFQMRVSQLEEEAAERQAELVEPIMERISNVIEEVRRDQNYSLILDVAAGSIIAADPRLDITEQVLTRLRATAGNP